MKKFLTILLPLLVWTSATQAADHAVILLYHHVSSNTPPSTSVSPQTFKQHLEYLAANDFKVLPLSEILQSFAQKKEISDKAVAITFDDAYVSVLNNGLPLLREKNWPFTLFVNTQAIDKGYRNYLSWSELRAMIDAGAEIGNHSHSHDHLVRKNDDETVDQWQTRIREDINFAQQRLREELDVETKMFAYPYGEYSEELKEIIAELGMFGIAQQSGAVGFGFDRVAVPRFPLATNYADMNRFATSVKSRPLPVTAEEQGPIIQNSGESSKHNLRFYLQPGDYQENALACYTSSGTKLNLTKGDNEGKNQISIPLPDWAPGRRKINCTAPSVNGQGEYYWYSWQWLIKQKDGQWYAE